MGFGDESGVEAANALTARWAAAACAGGGSTVFSGAGAWPLLAFLAAGAGGRARDDLEWAVGMDAGEAARAGRAVLEVLAGSPAVRSAVGLWTRRGLPLRREWARMLPAETRGELRGDPAEDRRRLDAWAAEWTGGLIPAMPVAVTPGTLLILAGALTVRTTWLEPFTDGSGAFETGPWAGRRIAVLNRHGRTLDPLRVAVTPGGPLTMLRVAGEDEIDVHLVLGDEARPAGDVLAAGVDALAGRCRTVRAGVLPEGAPAPGVTVRFLETATPDDGLSVRVPRFTVTSSHDLLETPEVFGLDTVTDASRGHFPGISADPLAIDQARQDAHAAFHARGFEAAAVTAFGTRAGAATPSATHRTKNVAADFDRPFGFLARHRPSGLILAAGRVAEPEPPG